jgi:hypothetical protein
MDAVTACYHFAGPHDPTRFSLRDLWLMFCGRQAAIRRQVLWQASVLFNEKLDVQEFLRCGSLAAAAERGVTMSDELRAAVEEEQGRLAREREAAIEAAKPKVTIVDEVAGPEKLCPACNGAKRIQRGRSQLKCRRCNGRGKVAK